MIILFWHGDPAIQVSGTNFVTLPVDCQMAITDDSTRTSEKYRAGNVSQLGRAQFKSVFGEK